MTEVVAALRRFRRHNDTAGTPVASACGGASCGAGLALLLVALALTLAVASI